MSALLISAGIAVAGWAAYRVWRLPVRGLRAADVEAEAWSQVGLTAPESPGGGFAIRARAEPFTISRPRWAPSLESQASQRGL